MYKDVYHCTNIIGNKCKLFKCLSLEKELINYSITIKGDVKSRTQMCISTVTSFMYTRTMVRKEPRQLYVCVRKLKFTVSWK